MRRLGTRRNHGHERGGTPAVDSPEPAEVAPVANGFHREPRCRVCRNDAVREKVNGLLALGASYAQVARALAADNAELDKCDEVTVDSVRTHAARHFPVQNVAKAIYREILERRARENAVDFVNGVATALTPMAFLETVMVRAYETLVDPGTTVDVNTGMLAAGRLQALVESRAGETEPRRDHREDESRHRGGALDSATRVVAGDQAQARGRRRARRAAGGAGRRGFRARRRPVRA